MRRSRLETYLEILEVLERVGQLKLTQIMYETKVNCRVLQKYLSLLMEQGLVEEQTAGRQRIVYSITQRGIRVLNYFIELNQVLPIVDENNLTLNSIQSEAPSS